VNDKSIEPQTWRNALTAIYVVIFTAIVAAAWIVSLAPSPQIGWDFPVFYIAAHLPATLLYSRDAYSAFWRDHLLPIGVPHWAPYVRPAAFALLLRPLLNLPYYKALLLWLTGGYVTYAASVALLLYRFQLPGFLFPAYAAFFPAIVGIASGSDVSIYLLALIGASLLLECRHDLLAGCVLVACLCKFNLILLVPVMLLLQMRFRALAAFAVGTAIVVAVSLSLAPFTAYASAVADAEKKTAGFFPVGLRGFSNAIGQHWCYPVLVVAVVLISLWLFKVLPCDEAFSVAITSTLLISPYITWYDSALLALPLTVIYVRSTQAVRVACIAILVAVPLWNRGGGNNGPIGFMHVGVETLILIFFIRHARAIRSGHSGALQ